MLKILAYDISNIPTLNPHANAGFWGLNIHNAIINDFVSNNIISDLDYVDCIWLYGYAADYISNPHIHEFIQFINKNVTSCKSVIFDLQGEGHTSEIYLKYFDYFRQKINLNSYKPKILWNLNKKISYLDYDIFYENYYELIYWYHVGNINKLEFKNTLNRNYAFSFLNGVTYQREHRYKMIKRISLDLNLSKLGILSNLDKRTDLPYLEVLPLIESENRFASTEEIIRSSYINIVSESSCDYFKDTFFITEKSIKPFVLQQIPLFLGPKNIVSHYRNYGFDVFDDLINHSYDEIDDLDLKVNLIYDELSKIIKYDLKELFLKLNSRLLHNFNLFREMITHINDTDIKLKKWILN